jgi:hypothetical protein
MLQKKSASPLATRCSVRCHYRKIQRTVIAFQRNCRASVSDARNGMRSGQRTLQQSFEASLLRAVGRTFERLVSQFAGDDFL